MDNYLEEVYSSGECRVPFYAISPEIFLMCLLCCWTTFIFPVFPFGLLHCLVRTNHVPLFQWREAAPFHYTGHCARGFTCISLFDPHIPMSIQSWSPFYR